MKFFRFLAILLFTNLTTCLAMLPKNSIEKSTPKITYFDIECRKIWGEKTSIAQTII